MRSFQARTASGAYYTYEGGILRVTRSTEHDAFVEDTIIPSYFKVVDRTEWDSSKSLWSYLETSPSVDGPEIGKSIYISGGSSWRLSQSVVEIMWLSDE